MVEDEMFKQFLATSIMALGKAVDLSLGIVFYFVSNAMLALLFYLFLCCVVFFSKYVVDSHKILVFVRYYSDISLSVCNIMSLLTFVRT